jgi:hypothetical protein
LFIAYHPCREEIRQVGLLPSLWEEILPAGRFVAISVGRKCGGRLIKLLVESTLFSKTSNIKQIIIKIRLRFGLGKEQKIWEVYKTGNVLIFIKINYIYLSFIKP